MNTSYLWKKESSSPNSLYVDLFDEARCSSFYRDATVEILKRASKNDELALKYRREGNQAFERDDLQAAVELFNKSLCFAVPGSDQMGLAYANRAFCFLIKSMYQNCLSDIQLAKKFNYPKKLMPKLERRETECLVRMKKVVNKKPFKPKLSFPSDATIPNMSNAIKIERNSEFGRHIVARNDIEPDQTILFEEPMYKVLCAGEYKRCLVCLSDAKSLISCDSCTTAMFCAAGPCSSNVFHKYECSMKNIQYFDGSNGAKVRNGVRFAIQAVLTLLDNFPSVDALIGFIDECMQEIANDPYEIAISDGSFRSMWKTIMKLHKAQSNEETFAIFMIQACFAYDTFISYPELKAKFATLSEQRFLMHLIAHLLVVFKSNNALLCEWHGGDLESILSTDGFTDFGGGLFNIQHYLNHSCVPNAVSLSNERYAVVTTIRPIKKGDQIFVKCGITSNQPTKERREWLLKRMRFLCKCELCLQNGPAYIDDEMMLAYGALACYTSVLLFDKQVSPKELERIKKKLYEFLAKFRNKPFTELYLIVCENLRIVYINELQNMCQRSGSTC